MTESSLNRDAVAALEAVIGRVVFLEDCDERYGQKTGRTHELRGMVCAAEILAEHFPREAALAEGRVADRFEARRAREATP